MSSYHWDRWTRPPEKLGWRAPVERLGRVVEAAGRGPDGHAGQPPGAGDRLPPGEVGVEAVGEARVAQAAHQPLDDVAVLALLRGGARRPGLGRAAARRRSRPPAAPSRPVCSARDGVRRLGVADVGQLAGAGAGRPRPPARRTSLSWAAVGKRRHGVGLRRLAVGPRPARPGRPRHGFCGERQALGQPDDDERRRRRRHRQPEPADGDRALRPGDVVTRRRRGPGDRGRGGARPRTSGRAASALTSRARCRGGRGDCLRAMGPPTPWQRAGVRGGTGPMAYGQPPSVPSNRSRAARASLTSR